MTRGTFGRVNDPMGYHGTGYAQENFAGFMGGMGRDSLGPALAGPIGTSVFSQVRQEAARALPSALDRAAGLATGR